MRGRLLSCLAALALAPSALLAPAGCTSFRGDDTPAADGGAVEEAAPSDAPFADTGKDDCRVACSTPCFSDPFDDLSSSWSREVGAGNDATVAGGVFTSTVTGGGAAFLRRRLRLTKDSVIRVSFVAIVDVIPPNGASLTKVVDDDGNEMNVRVDDGRLHACLERKTLPGDNKCTELTRKLVVGERIRVTLGGTVPSSSRTGSLGLRIDCDPQVNLSIPLAGVFLRTDLGASLHFGLESNGPAALRVDSVDLFLPE